ncbi:MAG: SOS response-associated peptidase [Gammaproteobacteria bacterium]|jgi:putative SOS response-associated peptidase YedK
MCGRYNIIANAKALYDAFQIISADLDFNFVTPLYNVSPTAAGADKARWTMAPIVRITNGEAEALPAVWPLIPKWAKGQVPKYSTANAKAETVATTKSYQQAWKRGQRCLIPATGFYEWQVVEGTKNKQPYHIKAGDQPVFAMAGIWEQSRDEKTGENVLSYSILTTKANALMAEIHNTRQRMPVIVSPDDYNKWLHVTAEQAQQYCLPYPADKMTAYKISTYVNNPNNNDERCIEKLEKSG